MNETVARRLTGLAGIATAAAFVIEVPLYFLYSGPPPDSNVLARLLIGIQARDSSPPNAPARSSGHPSVWRWTSGRKALTALRLPLEQLQLTDGPASAVVGVSVAADRAPAMCRAPSGRKYNRCVRRSRWPASPVPAPATGYSLKTFDLSAFAGQTVTLKFSGVEETSLQTSFVVEYTALTTS
ncbi:MULTISPECIES: hypothetical protein [unclassified Streptomyces]|uniref:hypothetical protein n=1 Tax=unclassified Streptomyces TaxID=2593676 RepID=UPI0004C6F1C5|nr:MULTISPECIES: hypothetical protein [unclassified Streptomyces]KOV71857.1 hypothetical protein ADL02_45100 [Streptomyces sp. NRRL WC-3723]